MTRLREFWRFGRIPGLGLVLLATLVLGYVGAAESSAISARFTDRLYAALRVFALNSDVPDPVPVPFEIARFAAPLLLGATALSAALLLFREEALRARAALGRNHTVIVGLGERGLRLVIALSSDDGHEGRVVAIDHGRNVEALAEAAAARVPVFIGDGTDPRVLRDAGVHRASHVVFLTDDDLVNLEGAAAVGAAIGKNRTAPVTVHVVVRDVELWRSLSPSVIKTLATTTPVEFVSVERRAAEKLVEALPAEIFRGYHRLALIADGTLGEAVVAEAVQRAAVGGGRLSISLVAEDSVELLSRWRARSPKLDDVVDIDPTVATVSGLPTELLSVARAADAAIIAVPDERVALAAALYLNRVRAVPPDHLVLGVADHALGTALADGSMLGIRIVGVLSNTLTRSLLLEGTRERLARAKHAHYLAQRYGLGETAGTAPALHRWDELPPTFRMANRKFAERLASILEELSMTVVPRSIGPVGEQPLDLPPDKVESLARQEHDAWIEERRAAGYSRGGIRNDDPTKGPLRHPLMIPYDELDSRERDKDLEAMRDLPQFLAAAGFTVARSETTPPIDNEI